MEKKMRVIGEETVEVAVYGGKMRFMVEASFYMLSPQNIEHYKMLKGMKLRLHCNQDGSADITAAALVSWDMPDGLLQEYADLMINEIENAMEINPGNLSSSRWHAGHEDPRWDDLLPAEDRLILEK